MTRPIQEVETTQALSVFERPNPFAPEVKQSLVRTVPGKSLAFYITEFDFPVITLLDGVVIPPERRMSVVPRPGQQLIIARDLTGGGGSGKTILRSLAMLAIMVVAVFVFGPGGLAVTSWEWSGMAATAAMAGVMVGGSLLVNALLPPPGMNGSKQQQNYGWSGAQMTAQEGLPIPKQGGMMRRAPNVVESYVTTTLSQQWLNILLDFGWGPGKSVTGIEVNSNPLSSYPNVWTDIRLGHNEQAPIANFSNVVNTYPQATRVRTGDGGYQFMGVGTAIDAFEIEVEYPKGIWAGPNGDGSYDSWTVVLQLQYRKVGALSWETFLRPRTTAGLPVSAQNQAPYWLAVSSQWTPNPSNTQYVLDVSYGARDHKVGDQYKTTQTITIYDQNGNATGTKDVAVYGTWVINPQGPGAALVDNPGVDYVSISDYMTVSHVSTWNRTVLCRDTIRVDNLDPGQYEFKVIKLGGTHDSSGRTGIATDTEDYTRRGEEVWVSALREIQYQTLSYSNKILLGIRALATDKLSGSGLNVTAVIDMDAAPGMGYKNEVAYDLPAAYWRMDDNNGTCADLTGHGHDGAYSGASQQGVAGLICGSPNMATRFVDQTTSVALPAPIALPANGWALELWLSGGSGRLFANADGSVYVERTANGNINFHYGGADHLSVNAIAANTVAHVVLGITPGGFLCMINGAPEFMAAVTEIAPAWSLQAIAGGFSGVIDEVAVYTYGVQPGRFKQHYITGSIGEHSALEDRQPDNPAMMAIDMLVNPLYGGQESPKLIDVPAFTEWADHCDELVPDGQGGQIYRHIFNGVFDQTESLWKALGRLSQMSRTVLYRTGTTYTCVADKPASRSQMFTMGNIKQDSFKQSWPALLDRANSVSGEYLDETNNWKKTPLRVMDEEAIAAGAPLQEAGSVDLFGITNARAAWRELYYRLAASKAAAQTVQLDCALEGLAAKLGSVVGVQHDVPQWGSGGRILQKLSDTKLQLDQKVTMVAGTDYVFGVILPTVLQATGTIANISGALVTVTACTWDGESAIKRLVDATGADVPIVNASTANGVAYLTVKNSERLSLGNCKLYDIDVMEIVDVVNTGKTTDTITLRSALSGELPDFATYFFGQPGDIRDFRVVSVGRRADQEMTLALVQYDPDLYGDLEPTLPVAATGVNDIAVTNVQAVEDPNSPGTLNVSWTPGKLTAGARVYLTRDDLPEYLADDVRGRNYTQLAVSANRTYTVRVVGYNAAGYSAPFATAPTATITPLGVFALPANVANFYCSACASNSATVNWTDNPATDEIDHYEVRYGGTISNPSWDFSTPLVPNPSAATTSATFANGPGQYLIKAVNAKGLSSALVTACTAVVGSTATSGSGGGGYGGGTGSQPCFSGNVEIETSSGFVRFDCLPEDLPFEIRNDTGVHQAILVKHRFSGAMLDFTGHNELVTLEHHMRYRDGWRPAEQHYPRAQRVQHDGWVYNMHVLSKREADLHYRLRNGDRAHNMYKANPN